MGPPPFSNISIGLAGAAGAISLSFATYLYVRTNSGQVMPALPSNHTRVNNYRRASSQGPLHELSVLVAGVVQSGFHSKAALPGYTAGVRGAYLNTGSRDIGPDLQNSPYIRYKEDQDARAQDRGG